MGYSTQTRIITGAVKDFNREITLTTAGQLLTSMLSDGQSGAQGVKLKVRTDDSHGSEFHRAVIQVLTGVVGMFPSSTIEAAKGFKYTAGEFIILDSYDLLAKMYFRQFGGDATTISVLIQS